MEVAGFMIFLNGISAPWMGSGSATFSLSVFWEHLLLALVSKASHPFFHIIMSVPVAPASDMGDSGEVREQY